MDAIRERLGEALAGRYRVDRELGRGGMGVVYAGYHHKLERSVAIKVLHPEFATAIGVERFRREIRVTAVLNHPHIVQIYDAEEADGLLYYFMPLVEGETLEKRLQREGALPIAAAMSIGVEVAEALAFAHSRGLVHRDVKPGNILLSGGSSQLADFGIARTLTAAELDQLTGTGVIIGTPDYMSPEQSAGEPIDARADVYSLGCVLYEMLTGAPPFSGNSREVIIARRMHDLVPSMRTVRREVSVALERVVFKALAKLPADRFATAAQLADALRDPSAFSIDEVSQQSIAVLPFTNVSHDPDMDPFSDGITEDIIDELGKITGLHVAPRIRSFKFREKAVEHAEIGADLRVATVLEGSVQRAGPRLRITARLIKASDGFQLWSQRYDCEITDASVVFEIQAQIAKAIAGRLLVSMGDGAQSPVTTPPTSNFDAYNLYLTGRRYWALRGQWLKKALECFGQALVLDPDYALAHAGLADACTVLAEYGLVHPDKVLPTARTAIERALHLAPDLAEANCAAATVHLVFDWDWTRAAQGLRRAIQLNPRYGAAHTWLALYLSLVESRFEEAREHAERAVKLDPAPLPLAQLGMVLIAAGRHAEAFGYLREAAESGPTMLLPHLYLGVTYNHLGKTSKAIEYLQTAAEASGRHQFALAELAVCYHTAGRVGDAEAIYDEIKARARGGEHIMSSMQALLAASVGSVDEAFQLLEKACDERDGIMIYSRRYPAFDLLQLDPRMKGIYRRIGFPE